MVHQWKPGDACRTYDGRRCRIIGLRVDGRPVWEVQESNGGWRMYDGDHVRDSNRPEPPMRTINGRACYCESTGLLHTFTVVEDTTKIPTVPIRWAIGEDGQPIHAVRLNEFGTPMFRVEEVSDGR